jgi:hypothetical protein
MSEDIEYVGYWWLPEEPANMVAGKLLLTSGDEITLELEGAFRPELTQEPRFNPALILGVSNKCGEITLHRCHQSRSALTVSGYLTSNFQAGRAFVGVHFDAEEKIRFTKLTVCYDHLDAWVNRRDFHVEPAPGFRFTIHYEPSPAVTAAIPDYEIAIGNSGSYRVGNTQVTIAQKAYIAVSSAQGKPLDDCLKMMHDIRDFLSLAMGAPTHPVKTMGDTGTSKPGLHGEEEFGGPVEVHYPVNRWTVEAKPIHSDDMPFTLLDVQDDIEVYLTNWLRKAEELRPVYDLLFSVVYNPDLYLVNAFLMLTQAVETYHRRQIGGSYQTDEVYRQGLYQRFVEVIPSDLDKSFKQSLKEGKLKFANEYSLRKRLADLMDRLSSSIPIGFLGSRREVSSFITKVCVTRNYLTHYTPELKKRSAQDQELRAITRRLRAVLEMCLLKETGFDYDTIRRIVSTRSRYRYLLE